MTTQRHSDPTINAFLADGDYANLEEWALDSDYEFEDGVWLNQHGDDVTDVLHQSIEADIEGAIEASGFEDPHAFADGVRTLLHAEGIDRL